MQLHSIKNGSDLGLRIDSKSGVISIADYSKVMESLEAGNGILNVTVKADKAEYSKEDGGVKRTIQQIVHPIH